MDIIKQNKIGRWIIVLLVVLNMLMLSSIWLKEEGRGGPPPPGRKDVVRFLQHELDLNNSQVKQLSELRDKHFAAMQGKLDRIMELKKELMDGAFESPSAIASPDSLAKEIGRIQAEIELITFNHFRELAKVCGEEKLPELKRMINEIVGPPDTQRPRLGTPPPPPQGN